MAECAGSNPIYYLGVTSDNQICDSPVKGAQYAAKTTPKGCQHIQSQLTSKDVHWDPGNSAHHLLSILVTLKTMGNTF